MSNKPRNVDLGPIYLQVGQDGGTQDAAPPAGEADTVDVARFESLMHRSRERQQQETDAAVDMLLDPLAGSQPQELADASEIGDELAHLWVGTGLRSGREVRMGLRAALLPETSVRLHDSEGLLRVEFTCGTHRVAHWLLGKLPAVASELGERLARALEVAVFMGDGTLVGSRTWPEAL